MTISFRAVAQTSSASTAATISVTVPAGAQAGDLAVLAFSFNSAGRTHELSAAGWVQAVLADDGATNAVLKVWTKTLTAGDLGTTLTVTSSTDAAASYKRTLALLIYTGATAGAAAAAIQSSSTTSHPAPAVTVVDPAGWTVNFFVDRASPGSTDFAIPANLTRRAFYAHTGGGAVTSLIADDDAVGSGSRGANTATGTVSTANGLAATLALEPVGNTPPSASVGPNQADVEPFAAVTLAGAASDPDGTIVSRAWTQTGGTPVSLSGASSATATFTAPAGPAGDTLSFAFTVTDDDGASASASLSVTVLPHNEWAAVGGALVPVQVSAPSGEAQQPGGGIPGGGGGSNGPVSPPPPRRPPTGPLLVTVFDGAYRRIGRLADYTSASVTHQHLGVGTGTLVIDEGDGGLPAAQLLKAETEVVPVVVDDGVKRWTGRVQHAALDGPPGFGDITATLTSDYEHLKHILAWQVPTAPLSGQNAAEHDVRTGPLVTVGKAYLRANIARLGDAPYAVVPAAAGDTSPTVTLRARMTPMTELLEPPCREHGYQLTAELWLPGWQQPPGLALTQATIVFDIRPVDDVAHVLWRDQVGIDERSVQLTHPGALRAIVGMGGEGVDRQYTSVAAADARASTLGRFVFREMVVNATDVDTAADGQARGRDHLAEEAGTAAIGVTASPTAPFLFGTDYTVGSRIRVSTGGAVLTDLVERVTVSHNRTDGRVVIPQIGASDPTETPEAALIRTVAALQAQVAAENTRK